MSKNANDITATYLSDAHLFAGGLQDKTTFACLARLQMAMENSQLVVLNGDIFELPFSRLGFSRTVARAVSTLDYLLTAYPKVEMNYVVGNHDGDPVFVSELQKLAKRHHNFQVSEKYLLLEGKIASHGDLMAKDQIMRETEFKPQFSWKRFISEVQLEGQQFLKTLDYDKYNPKDWSGRVNTHLEKHWPGIYGSVNEVITGHTHVPYEEYEHNGKKYTNSGTTFDRDTYRPVVRKISADAFKQYKERAREEPCPMLNDSEKRAVKRVNNYLLKAEEPLKKIHKQSMTLIDKVDCISDLYKDI